MSRFTYSPEMQAFLKQGYVKMRIPALTEAFNKKFATNKTTGQIRSCLKNKYFTCGRPTGSVKGEKLSLNKKQIAWLTKHAPDYSRIELTHKLNEVFNLDKTVDQIIAFIKNHKIFTGRTGRFEKGHAPWNAGTKGQGLTSANKTSFKKGSIPGNVKPLGHERICSKDGYIMIKIAEPNPYTGAKTRYKAKQLVVWEQHNGKIPDGHVITFLDSNNKNCAIENLECISKAENCRRNKMQYSKQPPELQPVIRTLARVITRTHQLQREQEDG